MRAKKVNKLKDGFSHKQHWMPPYGGQSGTIIELKSKYWPPCPGVWYYGGLDLYELWHILSDDFWIEPDEQKVSGSISTVCCHPLGEK